jgi:hypothetical protein
MIALAAKATLPLIVILVSFSTGYAIAMIGSQVQVQILQKANTDMQYHAAKMLERIKAKTDTQTMILREDCVDLVKAIQRDTDKYDK